MPPKAKGAKKKAGYQMPEQFNAGFVLRDVYKKPWCLGKPIGQGGFGLIYIGKLKFPIYFFTFSRDLIPLFNLFKKLIGARVNCQTLTMLNT